MWTSFRTPDGWLHLNHAASMTIDPLKWGKLSLQDHLHIWNIKKYYPLLGTYAPTYTSPSQTDLWEIGQKLKYVLKRFSGSPSKQQASLFLLFVKPREEHLRYEKRIQTGPDSRGSLRTFHPNKESGHRGERRSWEQTFHADMWETSQGRLTSFTAWAFFLVSGVSIVRVAVNEIHQPCADTATRSIWEYFLLQLLKHQSRPDPFEPILWHISVNLQGVTLKGLVKLVPQHARPPH